MHVEDLYSIVVTERRAEGLLLTLPLEDAAAEFERRPRFAVYDPSGAWVDVIQQIEPAPGFWERRQP